MFVGTSQRKLDDKGRIALPAALRDELQGLGYVTVTDDNVSIFTEEAFLAFADDVEARVVARGEVPRVVLRKLFADSQRIRADSQGRVTLPAELLESAGIGSGAGTEVVLTAGERKFVFLPKDMSTHKNPTEPAAPYLRRRVAVPTPEIAMLAAQPEMDLRITLNPGGPEAKTQVTRISNAGLQQRWKSVAESCGK